MHYFFSDGLDLETFLNDTEIKIRITNGPDWNKLIAEGSTKPFNILKISIVRVKDINQMYYVFLKMHNIVH